MTLQGSRRTKLHGQRTSLRQMLSGAWLDSLSHTQTHFDWTTVVFKKNRKISSLAESVRNTAVGQHVREACLRCVAIFRFIVDSFSSLFLHVMILCQLQFIILSQLSAHWEDRLITLQKSFPFHVLDQPVWYSASTVCIHLYCNLMYKSPSKCNMQSETRKQIDCGILVQEHVLGEL